METRGRRATVLIGIAGLLAIIGAGVAFRRPLEEEWWLWRLRSVDVEAKKAAAHRLAEMGSARGVRAMLPAYATAYALETFEPIGLPDDLEKEPESSYLDAVRWIARTGDADAVLPVLLEFLDRSDDRLRLTALWQMAWMGPGARPAAAAVRALLRDRNPLIREYAAFALGRTGDPAGEAALLEILDGLEEGRHRNSILFEIERARGKPVPTGIR